MTAHIDGLMRAILGALDLAESGLTLVEIDRKLGGRRPAIDLLRAIARCVDAGLVEPPVGARRTYRLSEGGMHALWALMHAQARAVAELSGIAFVERGR